jgi:hypothetical protein
VIQLIGDQVYYAGDNSDIGRVTADGTGDEVLVPAKVPAPDDAERAYDWTLTADALLWVNDWQTTGVRACTLPDCPGGPETLISTSTYPKHIHYAQANGTLYFGDGTVIKAKPWPSGTITSFVEGLPDAGTRAVLSDSLFLYWATADGIHKRALQGGPVVDLVTSRTNGIAKVVVSKKTLYWTEGFASAVFMTPLPNGSGATAPAILGDAGDNNPRCLALNAKYVYWGNGNSAHTTLHRCPLEGCSGPPQIIANLPTSDVVALALDDEALYWVTYQGDVQKLAL